jgi:hypothetical protein
MSPANQLIVQRQIDRWEKKHKEGKPISIPKWYHCTPDASDQKMIVESEILYAHKKDYGGAFVANYPEVSYGKYVIGLDSRIEKTGTNNGTVPPKCSKNTYHKVIEYNDEEVLATSWETSLVWMGFQRGSDTVDTLTKRGTKGIPLYRKTIIESDRALEYYEGPIAFLSRQKYWEEWPNVCDETRETARINRLQFIPYDEVLQLQQLITNTFALTFPKYWQGKI